MEPLGNDRWRASFASTRWAATSTRSAAWVDHWVTWRTTSQAPRRGPGRHGRPPDRRGARGHGGRRAGGAAQPRTRSELERWAARLREGRPRLARWTMSSTRWMSATRTATTSRPGAAAGRRRRSRPGALLEPGTSCSPAPRRRTRRATERSRTSSTGSTTCRPGLRRPVPAAHPSDRHDHSARARTTRRAPSPATRACPGRSAAPTGGHTAVHPELGDARRTSTRWSKRRASAASRSRSTSPSRPRPTTRGSREHPSWFRAAPRRHDPVRREPAEEIPGHLPVRLRVATTGAALWHELRDDLRVLDRPRRRRSSGSTTRTPRHSRSGSGASASSRATTRRRSSWPRRSPGRR